MKSQSFFGTLFLSLLLTFSAHAWQNQFSKMLKNGGALVEDDRGNVLFAHKSDTHFIPASTTKIAMAAYALDKLGADHRFKTEFFLDKNGHLIVKGYGDPFLVSEEIAVIAENLKNKGLKKINKVTLDTSYFSKNVIVDGASNTSNPYDAINGALLANFNTVYFHKVSATEIRPGEKQTPVTNATKIVAKKYGRGKHRVNIGRDPILGAQYFGELLVHFLAEQNVLGTAEIKIGTVPESAKLFYTHKSSKTLADVCSALLEYSTNFMSNQLFLIMGAEEYSAPATLDKGRQGLKQFLAKNVGWKNFEMVEGAGLSRKNQVTPKHMITLLRFFEPYKNLLPLKDNTFRAKTGTLTGVNTYAGYFPLSGKRYARFVILVNSPSHHNYKFELAKILHRNLAEK